MQSPRCITADLESISRDTVAEVNATSSFLGYQIPEHRPYLPQYVPQLRCRHPRDSRRESGAERVATSSGIDTAVSIDGYHGDNAYTFPVGNISLLAERLLNVTRRSLYDAIAEAKPGTVLGDISSKLQDGAESQGSLYSRVLLDMASDEASMKHRRSLYGGGWTRVTHQPGMVLAIETMVNVGLPMYRYCQTDGRLQLWMVPCLLSLNIQWRSFPMDLKF